MFGQLFNKQPVNTINDTMLMAKGKHGQFIVAYSAAAAAPISPTTTNYFFLLNWNIFWRSLQVRSLPRWLSWLRHSAHRPGRSVGGAWVQFPGSTGRFCVRISGAHALRLISQAGKGGSTVSSIICERWLILS